MGHYQTFAHREVYLRLVGPIPDGLLIRHSCDNPPCVNPAHLLPGTVADNSADMVERNRQARGLTHKKSKLRPEYVVDIRAQRAAGVSIARLARQYGVTPGTIYFVVQRVTWKQVA